MTSSRTKLLLVGVGLMGQPYLAAARRLGLQVRAVEGAARAAGIADRLDGLHVARGELDELWAEGAWAAAVADRPDGVLAFTEWNVLGAALLQDRLGLPGPSLHAAVVSATRHCSAGCSPLRASDSPTTWWSTASQRPRTGSPDGCPSW